MAVVRGNFSRTRRISYPIRVEEHTLFKACNFAQASPHTVIFDPAPGVLLTFEECNLLNVSVPDGAIIIGGNLLQGIRRETGNPERPDVMTLCDCEKCACVRPTIQKILKTKLCRDEKGRWLHHRLKEIVRERRSYPELLMKDQAQIFWENEAAVSKWSILPVVEEPAPEPVAKQEAVERTWWERVVDGAKSLLRIG